MNSRLQQERERREYQQAEHRQQRDAAEARAEADEHRKRSYHEGVVFLTAYLQSSPEKCQLNAPIQCVMSDLHPDMIALLQDEEINNTKEGVAFILEALKLKPRSLHFYPQSDDLLEFRDKETSMLYSLIISGDLSTSLQKKKELDKTVAEQIVDAAYDFTHNEMNSWENCEKITSSKHLLDQLEELGKRRPALPDVHESPSESSLFARATKVVGVSAPQEISPSQEEINQYHREIAEYEMKEFFLLSLMYQSLSHDHPLRVIIDQYSTKYSVKNIMQLMLNPASEFFIQWGWQKLWIELVDVWDIEDYGCVFFTEEQLTLIRKDNLFLKLIYISEMALSACKLDDKALHVLRAKSILKIFDKLFRNIAQLPDWFDHYFDFDNQEKKKMIQSMDNINKIKLVFYFSLIVCIKTFEKLAEHDAAEYVALTEKSNLPKKQTENKKLSLEAYAKISIFLKNLQKEFGFAEKDDASVSVAFDFLSVHASQLFPGTQFELQDFVLVSQSVAAAHTRITLPQKRPSMFESIRSKKNQEVKTKEINSNISSNFAVSSHVTLEITDSINVSVKGTIDREPVLDLIQGQYHIALFNAFLGHYLLNVVVDEEDDDFVEDEYRSRLKAIEVENNPSKTLVQRISKRISSSVVDDKNQEKLDDIFRFVESVYNVLENLISSNERFKDVGVELRVIKDGTTTGDEPKNIDVLIKRLDDVIKRHDNFSADNKDALLKNLHEFYCALSDIRDLNNKNNINIFPPKFGKIVMKFSAKAMLWSIITLGLKDFEERLAVFASDKVTVPSIPRGYNQQAWEQYLNAVKMLSKYLSDLSKSNLEAIMPKEITCQLSMISLDLLESLISKNLSTNSMKALDLHRSELQHFVVTVKVLGDDIFISLRAQDMVTHHVIHAVHLHPSFHLQRDFDVAKIIHQSYENLVKRGMKSPGKESLNIQARLKFIEDEKKKTNQKRTKKDLLLLLGLYGLLYVISMQNAKIKTETSSRMAQVLYETCLILGVDLRVFCALFNAYIRDKWQASSYFNVSRSTSLASLTETNNTQAMVVLFALQKVMQTYTFVRYVNYSKESTAFLSDYFSDFAMRGNPYLQLLNIDKLINRTQCFKGRDAQRTRMLNLLNVLCWLENHILNLPTLLDSFLDSTRSTNAANAKAELSPLAKTHFAFVSVINFYCVVLDFLVLHFVDDRVCLEKLKTFFTYLRAAIMGGAANEENITNASVLGVLFVGATGGLQESGVEYIPDESTSNEMGISMQNSDVVSIKLSGRLVGTKLAQSSTLFHAVRDADPLSRAQLEAVVRHYQPGASG